MAGMAEGEEGGDDELEEEDELGEKSTIMIIFIITKTNY